MDPTVAGIVMGVGGMLIVGLAGLLITLLLRKDDRQVAHQEQQGQQSFASALEVARIEVRIENLEKERERCDQLTERVVHLEAFREAIEPRLSLVEEGLRAVVRIDERVKTLFRMVEELAASAKAGATPQAA